MLETPGFDFVNLNHYLDESPDRKDKLREVHPFLLPRCKFWNSAVALKTYFSTSVVKWVPQQYATWGAGDSGFWLFKSKSPSWWILRQKSQIAWGSTKAESTSLRAYVQSSAQRIQCPPAIRPRLVGLGPWRFCYTTDKVCSYKMIQVWWIQYFILWKTRFK